MDRWLFSLFNFTKRIYKDQIYAKRKGKKGKDERDEDKDNKEEETEPDYSEKLMKIKEKIKNNTCTDEEYELMLKTTKEKLLNKPLIGIDPGVKDFLNFNAISDYNSIKNRGNMIKMNETKINYLKIKFNSLFITI